MCETCDGNCGDCPASQVKKEDDDKSRVGPAGERKQRAVGGEEPKAQAAATGVVSTD